MMNMVSRNINNQLKENKKIHESLCMTYHFNSLVVLLVKVELGLDGVVGSVDVL